VRAGYKQTEVGIIPEDWEQITLGKFQEKVGSGITPKGGASVYKSSGRPFVRSQNVGWGQLQLKNLAFIDEKTHASFPSTELRTGDVLLNITGASIGRSAVVCNSIVGGNVNQHVCIIRTTKDLENTYLCYLLNFDIGQRQIDSFQAGGNREGLNFGQIRSFQFPKPPTTTEQKAIAGALSDVDGLIAGLEALIAKKRAIKTATMQQLLTGKTRLPGFGQGKGMKQTEIGEIPDDWEVATLLDRAGFIHGKAHEQVIKEDGQYVVVNSKFVSSEGKVRKHANANFCMARVGDVLMVLSDLPNGKALAKCYFVEEKNRFAVNQRVCIYRCKTCDPRYLFYVLNRNRYFLKLDDGVSQTHILNDDIRKCFIQFPPNQNEQAAIGNTIREIDKEIEVLVTRLGKTKAIKQGMMQELLTGRTRLI